MAQETKENLEINKLDIVADTGYYSSKEFKKCDEDNINAIVPQANKQQVQIDKGKFPKDKFVYNKSKDCYICPANQQLIKRDTTRIKNNKLEIVYSNSSTICKVCLLKDKCIPHKTAYKRIFRWEHEHITEQHNKKMKTQESKNIVKKRGSIVEHPFGTIKRTLGWDHFLVRGKNKVSGENALIMFTYNFKRLLKLIGITLFKKLCIAIKNKDLTQIREDIEEYIWVSMLYVSYILQFMLIFRCYKPKSTKL